MVGKKWHQRCLGMFGLWGWGWGGGGGGGMEFIYISSYRAVFSLFLIRKKILKLINPQTFQGKTLVTMVANTKNDIIGPSVLMNHSMIT